MSELEKRLDQWRTDLTASETLGAADIQELESHLREELDRLKGSGLSDDEAFLIASRRLGDRAALEAEFAKAHPHRRPLQRLSWMAIGVLLYLMAGYVATGIAQGGVLAGAFLGLRGYLLGIFAIALKATTVIGLFVVAWLLARQSSWSDTVKRLEAMSAPHLALLLVGLGLLDCVLIGAQIAFRLLAARVISAAEFGRVSFAWSWAGLAWTVLAPVLAAAVVLTLHAYARRRDPCCAGPSE